MTQDKDAKFDPSKACHFCGKTDLLPCMNTRHMEERAESGVRRCFDALESAGGGERSIGWLESVRAKHFAPPAETSDAGFDPSKPVKCKDGREVTGLVVRNGKLHGTMPIANPYAWYLDGRYWNQNFPHLDLVNVPPAETSGAGESDAVFLERMETENAEYGNYRDVKRLITIARRALTPPSTSTAAIPRLQKGRREDRLDLARRREIMLAGWENDEKLRDKLGSNEQATWWAGRCAADKTLQHPYVSRLVGGKPSSLCGSWADDVLAFRRNMGATGTSTAALATHDHTPTVALPTRDAEPAVRDLVPREAAIAATIRRPMSLREIEDALRAIPAATGACDDATLRARRAHYA